MPEREPTPDEVKAIVDALLAECGIPVESTADELPPGPAASFSTGGPSAAADFAKKDEPVVVPQQAPPRERFLAALADAAKNGKVKGQVTKGEAQKALKALAELPDDAARIQVVREALDGDIGKLLSKGAREALDEAASAGAGGWMDKVDAKRAGRGDD